MSLHRSNYSSCLIKLSVAEEAICSTLRWKLLFLILIFPWIYTSIMRAHTATENIIAPSSDTSAISLTKEIPEISIETPRYKGYDSKEIGTQNIIARTTLNLQSIEKLQIEDIHGLSAIVPGLHIPDYGSRMTSSIYIRGIGSRIDHPAMGLYIDGIPVLNKNGFDFEPTDIRSIDVLRGPQGTLYGRNTMGGVIDITTLSPLFTGDYTRIQAEYGSYNHIAMKAAHYDTLSHNMGYAISAAYRHRDGAYTNETTRKKSDLEDAGTLSFKFERQEKRHTLRHTTTADFTDQKGYPYRQLHPENGILDPIKYNDPCTYQRLSIMSGTRYDVLTRDGKRQWSATLAYQYLDDRMQMDNDFTPEKIFTLQQDGREHTINIDIALRPTAKERVSQSDRWLPLTGFNIWGKHLDMSAPVRFLEEGINQLILDNANKGLQTAFPKAELSFSESSFPIESEFMTRSFGISLYHHSSIKLSSQWHIAPGLRIEHERQYFNYNSHATIHYRLTPYINTPKPFVTRLKGNAHNDFTELSPTLSITWQNNLGLSWHSSVSRGYKSGGFNTQLFSDLLQQSMMEGLQKKMGLVIEDGSLSTADVISYKPEYSWNYETGIKYVQPRFQGSATLFYTDCQDQQLTVFPAGMQTGRMMTNAGKTQIYGAEASTFFALTPSAQNLQGHFSASYGYTHATFKNYISGGVNYKGKHIPYAPMHTLAIATDWDYKHRLFLHADYRACGPIYWNDANTAKQDFYGLLAVSLEWRHKQTSVKLWSKNLTNEEYRTFYFVSMQKHFLQEGKPRELGITITQTL